MSTPINKHTHKGLKMNSINIHEEIHYVPDYRSCPSGLGQIFNEDHITLITDTDCGPRTLDETKNIFVEINELVHIPFNGSENYELMMRVLERILSDRSVKYVYDTEMSHNLNMYNSSKHDNNIFTLEEWISFRTGRNVFHPHMSFF